MFKLKLLLISALFSQVCFGMQSASKRAVQSTSNAAKTAAQKFLPAAGRVATRVPARGLALASRPAQLPAARSATSAVGGLTALTAGRALNAGRTALGSQTTRTALYRGMATGSSSELKDSQGELENLPIVTDNPSDSKLEPGTRVRFEGKDIFGQSFSRVGYIYPLLNDVRESPLDLNTDLNTPEYQERLKSAIILYGGKPWEPFSAKSYPNLELEDDNLDAEAMYGYDDSSIAYQSKSKTDNPIPVLKWGRGSKGTGVSMKYYLDPLAIALYQNNGTIPALLEDPKWKELSEDLTGKMKTFWEGYDKLKEERGIQKAKESLESIKKELIDKLSGDVSHDNVIKYGFKARDYTQVDYRDLGTLNFEINNARSKIDKEIEKIKAQEKRDQSEVGEASTALGSQAARQLSTRQGGMVDLDTGETTPITDFGAHVKESLTKELTEKGYTNISDVALLNYALGKEDVIDLASLLTVIDPSAARNHDGDTILHWRPYMAVESPHEIKLFDEHAKDLVNVKGAYGNTPLMNLVRKIPVFTLFGRVGDADVQLDTLGEALEKYFAVGANPNIENDSGLTPLSLAAEAKNLNAVEQLLKYDIVDVNYKNKDGETALDFAYKALPTMTKAFTLDEFYSFGQTKDIIKALEKKGATRGKEVSNLDALRERILLGDSPAKVRKWIKEKNVKKDVVLRSIGDFANTFISSRRYPWGTWDEKIGIASGKRALKDLAGIAAGFLSLVALYKSMKPSDEGLGQEPLVESEGEEISPEIQEAEKIAETIIEEAGGMQALVQPEQPEQQEQQVAQQEQQEAPVEQQEQAVEDAKQEVEKQVKAAEEAGLTPSQFGRFAAWATGNERLKDPEVQKRVWDAAVAKTYEQLISGPAKKAKALVGKE